MNNGLLLQAMRLAERIEFTLELIIDSVGHRNHALRLASAKAFASIWFMGTRDSPWVALGLCVDRNLGLNTNVGVAWTRTWVLLGLPKLVLAHSFPYRRCRGLTQ